MQFDLLLDAHHVLTTKLPVGRVTARVLNFAQENRISSEIRPFRSGPVNVFSGQIISALFDFFARPSFWPSPRCSSVDIEGPT